MDLANGNVDMHFGKIAIQVDHEGRDLFQRVSSGIKAGDQSVTGKDAREMLSFLVNVQYEFERAMETLEGGSINANYYAAAAETTK
jgi:hypothetical protein